jgi:hypothetical protein
MAGTGLVKRETMKWASAIKYTGVAIAKVRTGQNKYDPKRERENK